MYNTDYFNTHPAERAEVLKLKYLDAKRSKDDAAYTFEQLDALRMMAMYDVWPDGRFGDLDCIVWSLFKNYRSLV